VLLGILERNIVFGETSLALSILQQYKPDLPSQKPVINMISSRNALTR
jgi:hypothetical protein